MKPIIRPAGSTDAEAVAAILLEAAHWLEQTGQPMWRANELATAQIPIDISHGLVFLAEMENEPAGTIKFQLEDKLFWPDLPGDDAAYVHRLAVRRKFSGQSLSTALLGWAAVRAKALGKKFLRLDCEASRLRLRAVYEQFGFKHHSDRQVGPYFVSRYQFTIL